MDTGTVEWAKVKRRKEVGPHRQRNRNTTMVSETGAKVVEPGLTGGKLQPDLTNLSTDFPQTQGTGNISGQIAHRTLPEGPYLSTCASSKSVNRSRGKRRKSFANTSEKIVVRSCKIGARCVAINPCSRDPQNSNSLFSPFIDGN